MVDVLSELGETALSDVGHTGSVRVRRGVYRLRPSWRPRFHPDVLVPVDLDLLAGPTSGVIDPPTNLYWQPGTVDLTDVHLRASFYSSALTRIDTAEQFHTWINRDALEQAWQSLAVPAYVRGAWEAVHPELKGPREDMSTRALIQDIVLEAIADLGFALAGGSALIDYDVVTRDTEDIDAFLDRLDASAFAAAADAVISACEKHGWDARLVHDQDLDKQVSVRTSDGTSTVVQLVYHQRSVDPERRPGGGLRLIFDDVVAGKAVAAADSARGRDFHDIAMIVETRGWTLERIEGAMTALGYPDMIERFRENIERFRRGEFDAAIGAVGLDVAFCHAVLG